LDVLTKKRFLSFLDHSAQVLATKEKNGGSTEDKFKELLEKMEQSDGRRKVAASRSGVLLRPFAISSGGKASVGSLKVDTASSRKVESKRPNTARSLRSPTTGKSSGERPGTAAARGRSGTSGSKTARASSREPRPRAASGGPVSKRTEPDEPPTRKPALPTFRTKRSTDSSKPAESPTETVSRKPAVPRASAATAAALKAKLLKAGNQSPTEGTPTKKPSVPRFSKKAAGSPASP